jgi:hypothetical protein
MNVDQTTLMYILIAAGAIFTLFVGVAAIGLVAWFFLRPAPRRSSALASAKKAGRSGDYDDDTTAVIELYTSYKEAKRLDAVRGEMAEAAAKKA